MENNIQNPDFLPETPKRSQTLTTLCILSFIMCAIGVLLGLYNMYQSQPDVMQQNIEKVRAFNPEMADQMENNVIAMQESPFAKVYPYINLVFILLSFLGVLMMWNMNKKGFYIYSIAEILPYSSYFFMKSASVQIPGMSSDMASKIMIITMVVMILIDVLFVGLYAKQTKDFK